MSPREEAPDWLSWRAGASPSSLALKCGRVEWSYAEMDRQAGALAASLRSRGVKRRDRVALLIPASETYLALVHAIARLGAVAVPLNHRLAVRELLSLVGDADPRLVIYEEALGAKAKASSRAKGRWAGLSTLLPSSTSLAPVPGGKLDLAGPHAIIYTSGSSGAPKGVVLSLSNLMWNAVSLGFAVGSSPEDRWLLCLPLFHIGGYSIIFRALLAGSGIVLHPKFEPELAALSLRGDRVTLASFVPTMLADLLRQGRGKRLAPNLRLVLVGGGRPTQGLAALVEEHGLPVMLTYGMTETCSFVALSKTWTSASEDYVPALPNEVRILETSGPRPKLSGRGEAGEISVRGPGVFSGYWRQPGLTKSRFAGGWFLTGDLGVLEDSGAIRVIGRKDATIVTGGEKVFPDEVESALRSHPSISEAVVVGVEDGRWGQMVVAVLEPKEGARRPSDAELKAFLGERLGRYKIPKRYVFKARLPKTSTGKPRREEVRKALEKGEA